MDPRHPEKALPRIKELIEQYERVEKDIASATVPNKIGEFEREGFMVIQEMSFITPRLHERLALITRQRRRDLGRGKVYEQTREYAATAERVEEPAGKPVHKWSSAEKVAEAREHLEQTIANSDVEKSVEKSVEEPEDAAVSKMETTTTTEENSATGSKMEQVEPVKEEEPKQTAKKKTPKKANK